jgi:hypothetical protein
LLPFKQCLQRDAFFPRTNVTAASCRKEQTMNERNEVLDAADSEIALAAVAIMLGSGKSADELILGFRAAKNSPLGVACATFAAADEADRAVKFASLQARATAAEARRVRADAMELAEACMAARGGWTVEALGHNIESVFGDALDAVECDAIARKALGL